MPSSVRLQVWLLLLVSTFCCSGQSVRGKASMVIDPGEVDDTSIVEYELDDPKCFDTTEELRQAVSDYQGVNTFNAKLGAKYGWPIGQWCVSNIRDFSNLFSSSGSMHHRYFNEPLDQWDMSHATDVSGMFQNCHWFNQPLRSWKLGNVKTMTRMFAAARNFNQPIGHWQVDQVQDMSYLFLHAFSFDQNLNSWNIRSVTSMEGIFRDARSFDATTLNWDVSHVENTKMMVSEIPGVTLNLRGQPQQQQTVITMSTL
jgi:Mycoplasma protein of unknown function, DUF285